MTDGIGTNLDISICVNMYFIVVKMYTKRYNKKFHDFALK